MKRRSRAVSEDVLKLADDAESFCKLVDPTKGTVQAPLHELSGQGALLGGDLAFKENDYIDATLHLKGVQPRPMFAHVVSLVDGKLMVRWLHFDGADEAKLKDLLERFANGNLHADERLGSNPTSAARPAVKASEAAEGQKEGTRRVTRPSQVFTPFAAKAKPEASKAAPATAAKEDTPAAKAVEPPHNVHVKQGTRRITRPSASMSAVTSGAPAARATSEPTSEKPASAPGEGSSSERKVLGDGDASGAFTLNKPGEESGGHVVIAPTAKFTKMKDERGAENPASTELPGKAKVVVGADGKMDIGATIRSQAKTVRASELAARHEKVRVLNMGTIKLLIQDAVGEAMQHLTANMGETEKKQLLQEAEAQFQERLKAFKAEKDSSDAYAKHLNEQLRKAQELLEDERKREIKAEQFTVSDAGMGQIEEKMKRVLDHALRTGNVSTELETKLREMIAHILDDERERIRKQEEEAQSAKIDLLEKKIKRLARDLDDTEKERDEARELANSLEQSGGGIRGIMTAGIQDSEGGKKRKLALMKEILDINRKIRDELGVKYDRDDKAVAKIEAERLQLKDGPSLDRRALAELQAAADAAREAAALAEESGAQVALPDESGAQATLASAAAASEPAGEYAETSSAMVSNIDPDDMEWSVKPIEVMSDEDRDTKKAVGAVKKIAAGGSGPPPLVRKPGG